jgi:hypothetical protein
LDKLARSASDLFNVHKLPVTHYRLHKTLQKNPGISGMVKNSHIREVGGCLQCLVCLHYSWFCTHRKAIILEPFMLSLVLVLHW